MHLPVGSREIDEAICKRLLLIWLITRTGIKIQIFSRADCQKIHIVKHYIKCLGLLYDKKQQLSIDKEAMSKTKQNSLIATLKIKDVEVSKKSFIFPWILFSINTNTLTFFVKSDLQSQRATENVSLSSCKTRRLVGLLLNNLIAYLQRTLQQRCSQAYLFLKEKYTSFEINGRLLVISQVMSHRPAESNASELSMNLPSYAANLHMTQRALTSPSARIPSPTSHGKCNFQTNK